MLTTKQALEQGYEFVPTQVGGYWRHKWQVGNDLYELIFEPLMWGQYYVAMYKNQDLMTEKVPVRPNLKQELQDND